MTATLNDFFVLDPPDPDNPGYQWLAFSVRTKDSSTIVELASNRANGAGVSLPVAMKVMRGRKPCDVFGTDSGIVIISDRLRTVLTAAGTLGAITYPAVIYDRRDETVINDKAWWLRALPGAAAPDPKRGVNLLFEDISYHQLDDAVGLYFAPDSWTGADVFQFPRGFDILVTRRIAEVIASRGIDQLILENAAQYGSATRDIIRARRIRNKSI
jgi:hypothetical protein